MRRQLWVEGNWPHEWRAAGPGAQAWQGFGRRMALGLFFFFIVGPLLLLTLLIVVATVAFDVPGWVWLVVSGTELTR